MIGKLRLSIAFLLISASFLHAQSVVETTRDSFHKVSSETNLEAILAIDTAGLESNDQSIVLAYHGLATSMMAEYAFSPFTKLKYFHRGSEMLDVAIERHKSVESVYLRLLLQLNVPEILNDEAIIEGDIAYISSHISTCTLPLAFKKQIYHTLLEAENEDYVAILKKEIHIE